MIEIAISASDHVPSAFSLDGMKRLYQDRSVPGNMARNVRTQNSSFTNMRRQKTEPEKDILQVCLLPPAAVVCGLRAITTPAKVSLEKTKCYKFSSLIIKFALNDVLA